MQRRIAFNKRQRLQWLDGRTGINRPLNIPQFEHNPPIPRDDSQHAAMAAFGQRAARDFDENGICHQMDSRLQVTPCPRLTRLEPKIERRIDRTSHIQRR